MRSLAMAVTAAVAVLLLVTSTTLTAAEPSWSGSFTDSVANGGYGGTLYICSNGTFATGVYSEIGFVQGEVNGRDFTGIT